MDKYSVIIFTNEVVHRELRHVLLNFPDEGFVLDRLGCRRVLVLTELAFPSKNARPDSGVSRKKQVLRFEKSTFKNHTGL